MKTLKFEFSNINSSNENNKYKLKISMIGNMVNNLYNFLNLIDTKIDSICINNIKKSLQNEDIKGINVSSYRLGKYYEYINLLDKQLKQSRQESIFKFSIISFTVIEREDFETFQKEREECPIIEEKILFYRTNNIPNSNKLEDLFNLNSKKIYLLQILLIFVGMIII